MGILDGLLRDLLYKQVGQSPEARGTIIGKAAIQEAGRSDAFLAPIVAALSGGISALTYSSPAGAAQSPTLERVAYDTQMDKLNTPSENRTKNMAQSSKQVEFNPEEILQLELTNQAELLTQEAQEKSQVAQLSTDHMATNSDLNSFLLAQSGQVSTVITNKTLGRDESGRKYAIRTSKGKLQDVELNPGTGEWEPTADRSPDQLAVSDRRTMAAAIERSTERVNPSSFNFISEMEKLRTLAPEEQAVGAARLSATLANLEAAEHKNIRIVAAQESGYTAAKAAAERNRMLDALPDPKWGGMSFIQRFGQPSAQTLIAEEDAIRKQQVADKLAVGLITESGVLREYANNKQMLNTIEVRRINRMEKVDQVEELELRSITETQVSNIRAAYPDLAKRGDIDVKRFLIDQQKRGKDKTAWEISLIDHQNIHEKLLSTNKDVANRALRVFLEYDKAANPRYRDTASTPTYNAINALLKDPKLDVKLLETIQDQDARGKIAVEMTMAKGDAKKLAEVRQKYMPNLLAKYMENLARGATLSNLDVWSMDSDARSALQSSIDKIKRINPKQNAPMDTVVNDFVTTEVKGPDGKPMNIQQKIAVLSKAIDSHFASMDKNLVITPDLIDSMRLSTQSQMRTTAARAHIGWMGSSLGTLINPVGSYIARRRADVATGEREPGKIFGFNTPGGL